MQATESEGSWREGGGVGEDFLEEAELEMERKRRSFQGKPLFSPFPTAAPTWRHPPSSRTRGEKRDAPPAGRPFPLGQGEHQEQGHRQGEGKEERPSKGRDLCL